jgi:hypothetical protein
MDVVPVSVGRASRAWDRHQVDLASAADLVAGAATDGFSSAVAGAASRFTRDWERITDALGAHAEERADGLRDTIRTYLDTEAEVADRFVLRGFTEEPP